MSGHSKWNNIKNRKGKQDAAKGKIFTKMAKLIAVAAREGGGDPEMNSKLREAVAKAKAANMPNDNIDRAIKKGSGELGDAVFEEITYEGYGIAGVALLVQTMTDNRNRTAAEMRHLFSKYGGNLGESGCVSWMFNKKGLVLIDKANGVSEDDLMAIVLESGGDDLVSEDDQFEITCAPESFEGVLNALEAAGVKWESADISMVPDTTISLSGEEATRLMKLVDALEEQDDVQAVFGNFELPDEEEEE